MEKLLVLVTTALFLVLSMGYSLYAQEKMEVLESKDPMIETLQRLRSASNGAIRPDGGAPTSGTKTKVSGYRVQIYSGNSRNDAYAAQSRFKRMYPHINTYLGYSQPNYRLKVGDFTNKSQAQSLMEELRKNFSSVFIFNEEVTIEY
ncbi:SPOR domain-containing protein [Olivibacter sitiensis]|uniref:SPOR domain-containing protein n=1 Tax=Olivibacter sitiensis TaxID=376470 RepID=UPI00047F1FAA|nr:SPOR domain-containing protein [Olivibacter sitiensis]